MRKFAIGGLFGLIQSFLLGLVPAYSSPDVFITENLDEKPMRFVHMRSDAAGCEPNCPEWIAAQGRIVPGTAKKFEVFLSGRDLSALPIILASQGGEWEEAMALGKIIRERKYPVAVARALFAGCGLHNWNCEPTLSSEGIALGHAAATADVLSCGSACILVLASGVNRAAGTWTKVGIVQISNALTLELYESTIKFYESAKEYGVKIRKGTPLYRAVENKILIEKFESVEIRSDTKLQIGNFLKSMNVDPQIIDIVINKPIEVFPNSQIQVVQYLTQHDMQETNLLTTLDSADAFISPTICKQSPPAGNCVER